MQTKSEQIEHIFCLLLYIFSVYTSAHQAHQNYNGLQSSQRQSFKCVFFFQNSYTSNAGIFKVTDISMQTVD